MRVAPGNQPNRMSEWLLAAVVGAVLLLLAGLLIPAWPTAFEGHGERFAAMAREPLRFDGDFPQRILWPLLAWLAGQVGISAPAFSQVCSAGFLAVVCWFARRRGARWFDAVLVTATVAGSGAVLVYQRMACFSDSLSLLLMVLLVHFAARPRVFWPLVLLSALGHEMVFLFWPWLVYLRCHNGGVWWREALWLSSALGLYLAFRAPMAGSYGASYYLENSFWVPWALPTMWALWAFVVLVEFGPLLIVVVWAWRAGVLSQSSALGGRFGPWLYLAGILPLMLLAYDVMRFATFVFLPLLLGGLSLVRRRHGRAFLATMLLAGCASYLLLHPDPSQQGGALFWQITGHVNECMQLLVTRELADAASFTWQLLVRTWPIAIGGVVGWLAVIAGGIWLGKYTDSVR